MKTCSDFETILVAIARHEPVSEPARTQCEAHLDVCGRCRTCLEQQRGLSLAFVAMRGGDQALPAAPPDSLYAEHRRLMRSRAQRRRAALVAGICAAAAAVFMLAATMRRPPTPVATPPLQQSAALTPRSVASEPLTPAHLPVKRATRRRHTPIRSREPERASPIEGNREFVALPYSAPLSSAEQLDVYRVQVPLSTFAQYGLPIDGRRSGMLVTADLAVGNDGVARAIRFVQ